MGHRSHPTLSLVSCTFRYDPYQMQDAKIVEEEVFALPEDTLHTALADQVSFLPYPLEEFYAAQPVLPKESMARVFLGQLPYAVTDMQLQWLCYAFGNGVSVHFPERIVKQDRENHTKIPTGCIHAYCHPDAAAALLEGMHKKLLIDDTGVWYADSPLELDALHEYSHEMKMKKSKRPQNRPYDTVVAQLATSTYVPKPPMYRATRHAGRSTPPPPFQGDASRYVTAGPLPAPPAYAVPAPSYCGGRF